MRLTNAVQRTIDKFAAHDCCETLGELLPPGYKLAVNEEHVVVYHASETEPYRSWTIEYSDGMQYNPTSGWQSLYREPRKRRCDMREFEKQEQHDGLRLEDVGEL